MAPGRSEREGSEELEIAYRSDKTGVWSNRDQSSVSERARNRDETALSLSSRRMVQCLRERGGEATLIRLAADVAIREYGTTPSPERIQQVYSRLYNDQLQQLLAAGVVSYSEEDGTVSLQ